MRTAFVVILVLLSGVLCLAQSDQTPAAEAISQQQLAHLVTALQKNPWLGWKIGTEVTARHSIDSHPGKSRDQRLVIYIYKVSEEDRRFEITYSYKGRQTRREFLIANEVGVQQAHFGVEGAIPAELEIDGVRFSCWLKELSIHEFPGGTRVTKEWILSGHPTILLRQDANENRWILTSAHITRTIGDKQFSCAEFKDWMRFYYKGPAEAVTTRYLCPEVPGHLVEEKSELFRIRKGIRDPEPFEITTHEVIEIKVP